MCWIFTNRSGVSQHPLQKNFSLCLIRPVSIHLCFLFACKMCLCPTACTQLFQYIETSCQNLVAERNVGWLPSVLGVCDRIMYTDTFHGQSCTIYWCMCVGQYQCVYCLHIKIDLESTTKIWFICWRWLVRTDTRAREGADPETPCTHAEQWLYLILCIRNLENYNF